MKLKLFALILIAVLAVSSASILVVLASALGAVSAFWRLFLSLPILYLFYKPKFEIKNFKLPLLSGISLSLHFTFWMESLFHASVAVSTAIVCMHSIFSGIFSTMYGEKPKLNHLIGVLIAISGVYLLSGADYRADFIGISFALFGAIAGGIYFSIGRLARFENFPTYILLTYLSATAFSFLTCIILKLNILNYSPKTWIFFVLLAFIPMAVGHTALNYALRYIHVVPVTASVIGEVIGSAILARVILGQILTFNAYLYITIILLGIFTTVIR